MLPSAPAATARSMNPSGSSVKTSTRTVLVPTAAGASQPLFSGSPTKTGAPSMLSPATPPRFHNSVAPSACLYQSTAAGASWTASMSEICTFGVIPGPSLPPGVSASPDSLDVPHVRGAVVAADGDGMAVGAEVDCRRVPLSRREGQGGQLLSGSGVPEVDFAVAHRVRGREKLPARCECEQAPGHRGD